VGPEPKDVTSWLNYVKLHDHQHSQTSKLEAIAEGNRKVVSPFGGGNSGSGRGHAYVC
jgi:hypothetical protein